MDFRHFVFEIMRDVGLFMLAIILFAGVCAFVYGIIYFVTWPGLIVMTVLIWVLFKVAE